MDSFGGMIRLSLTVNLLVLVPVLWGLLSGSAGMEQAFGADTPARRVLIAVYLAIALGSAALLVAPAAWRTSLVPGLLAVQVAYKVLTVPLLGIGHPVVAANLLVVAVHSVTLLSLTR